MPLVMKKKPHCDDPMVVCISEEDGSPCEGEVFQIHQIDDSIKAICDQCDEEYDLEYLVAVTNGEQ